jgi:hypothetical protein
MSRFVFWLIVGGGDEETVVELGQQWILDRIEILMVNLPQTAVLGHKSEGNQLVVLMTEL